MSTILTALYDTQGEAARALDSLADAVPIERAGIFDNTPSGLEKLRRSDLSREDLAACERKLAGSDHLLLIQAADDQVERVIAALEAVPPEGALQTGTGAESANPQESAKPVDQQRVPIVEEELRVGAREIVRGGTRVHSRVESVPQTLDVELLEETLRVTTQPANRRISDAELETADLLRERVFEIAQIREEAVVTKEAFVREEVVVTKRVERRVEHIQETLRHTEVETEDLGVGPSTTRNTTAGD